MSPANQRFSGCMENVLLLSFSPEGARVDGRSRSARVRSLIPWTEYRFGVVAINSAGEGAMAGVSQGEVCRTPAAVPQRSPRHVCTDSRQPHQLVIVWEVSLACFGLIGHPVVILDIFTSAEELRLDYDTTTIYTTTTKN